MPNTTHTKLQAKPKQKTKHGKLGWSTLMSFDRFVSREYYIYNIFTIYYRWLIVIGSNLNLILRLLFCLKNNNQ